MKLINYIEDKFPTYALSYVINGDASGMEDEDIANCDEWYARLTESLKESHPDARIEFLYDDQDESGSFTPYPAFGLACDTVDCVIAAYVSNESDMEEMELPWA
jgi:hypothetical protein